MKRFVFGLLFILSVLNVQNLYADTVSWDSIVSADDVTIQWLNGFKNTVIDALNSFPGDNIEAGTITANAMDDNTNPEVRWGEAFSEFVYEGLLPPTSATLTSITTAGTAYVKNDSTNKMTRVEKDATSKLYTASKDTYVDLSSNGTFTYTEVVLGGAEPATAANSIRLAKVVTNGTAVASVTDMRVLGVQLSTNEDYYIKGMDILWTDADRVSSDAGIVYVGGTRINKVATTGLNVGTASDYITGASERGTSKWLYVYVDDNGSVKLDDTAPNYANTSGDTVGTLRYFKNGTDYWRNIGAIRLNASGSGNVVRFLQVEDCVQWDVPISLTTTLSSGVWSSALSCSTAIPATSKLGKFELYISSNSATNQAMSLRPNGGTSETPSPTVGNIVCGDSNNFGGQTFCVTDSSQQIQYYQFSSTTVDAADVKVIAYYYNNR